ncbi:unnamed protein product [Rotaria sp. Silwood2]|nr:unnamed protein product [Rotaria sp. Silwood2]CAF4494875.1 unnamed protein product [Rotaria sp. Silwood2]
MDVDMPTIDENQIKEVFELSYKEKISSFEILNSSSYIINADNKYLMKLFSHSSISLEQLQSILSLCQCNGTILDISSIDQSHIVIFNNNNFSLNKQIGYLLAEWRLHTRNILKISWKNPFNNEWFNQQYAFIINKKKNSYPFLLSNLYTCQEQISTIDENKLEIGLLWNNNQQSFYLIDLVLSFLTNIDSFNDNIKEIIHAYEEIISLTNDEINLLDIFVRLQFVLLLNNQDIDDDKQLDLLEQLCSNVFFVRNLVR